jgi:hypothetical protein
MRRRQVLPFQSHIPLPLPVSVSVLSQVVGYPILGPGAALQLPAQPVCGLDVERLSPLIPTYSVPLITLKFSIKPVPRTLSGESSTLS